MQEYIALERRNLALYCVTENRTEYLDTCGGSTLERLDHFRVIESLVGRVGHRERMGEGLEIRRRQRAVEEDVRKSSEEEHVITSR